MSDPDCDDSAHRLGDQIAGIVEIAAHAGDEILETVNVRVVWLIPSSGPAQKRLSPAIG